MAQLISPPATSRAAWCLPPLAVVLGLAVMALPQVVRAASPDLRLLLELGALGGLAAGVALALLALQGRLRDPRRSVLAATLLALVAPTALLVLARVVVLGEATAAGAPGALARVSANLTGAALLIAFIVGRPRLNGATCALAVVAASVVPAVLAFTAPGSMAAGVPALMVIAGLLYVLAGSLACRGLWRPGRPLDLWIASSAWLLAIAVLGSRDVARVLGPEITTSDVLRSLAVGLLCAGGLLEVRRIVRGRAAAAHAQARDLDAANVLARTMRVALGQERSFRTVALHELVTPIATIRAFAHTLRRGADRTSLAALDGVESESRVLQAMVGRMDELRTLDLDGFACAPRPVALRPLLEEAAACAGGSSGGRAAVVECPDVVVHADPLRLGEALRNLVTNAVRHTPDGARVTLRGSVDDSTGAARVAVIDAGPGIPLPERERVLRSGERGAAEGGDPPGTGKGLGLYVARRIAEAHGGDLVLGDGDGGLGLSVTLRLPASP